MRVYVCDHCRANLGPLVEGSEEPRCPDHPDGSVTGIEIADEEVADASA